MRKRDVFINCPFSQDYQPLFQAIVFTCLRSGFRPRCALEVDDGSDNRFDKICRIIGNYKLGVHDISKTELVPKSRLPRFNMPMESGLFLAAKKFGGVAQNLKKCIIFDRESYRYQKFLSDISGQDIHSYGGKLANLIGEIYAQLKGKNCRVRTKDTKVRSGFMPPKSKNANT